MNSNSDLSWDEVHRTLVPLMRPDHRTNVPYLLGEYLLLTVVLSSCLLTYRAWEHGTLATATFWLLAVLGVAAVAVCQHRLSGLAHDASHYTLFKHKLANELVSDLFLLFPLVAMTQKYRAAHLGHHRWVNDPRRDPDLLRLNHPDPHVFPTSKASFWRRYVLRSLWPPAVLGYLLGRAKAANLGGETPDLELKSVYRSRVARSMRGAYWLSVFAAVHIAGAWPVFFLFWVVPLLTVYPMLMQLREIAHHSNAPDDGDLTNSRVFRVHPILQFAVFPYGQAFHLTHHLFAMIPHYRIAEAHEVLNRYRPYREQVVVCEGYFFRRGGSANPSLLDILSRPSQTIMKPHWNRTPSESAIHSRAG